jgi:hypothetical protein
MTQSTTVSRLGDAGFDPIATEKKWGAKPLSMIVIEYHGNGDAAFGGQGDDRVLMESGVIQDKKGSVPGKTARFATITEAHEAALKIQNRREGSILGVAPVWR